MSRLLVIDGNSILNRAFYGIMGSKMLMTKDGKYTNAVYGFLAIMFKVLDDLQPEYMAVAFDLKEPTGKSRTTIYDLFKHKSGQADNFVIDIHKSGLDRTESIEQAQQLFYSKHRSWINTVILMENNEIFKILKRR